MKTRYVSVRMTQKQWEAVIGCLSAALSGPWDGDAFIADTDAESERRYERAERADQIIKNALDREPGKTT